MLIITGSDDNYVPGVMVLIASAAFHNPAARFAVLDMGISDANRSRIDRLGEKLNVSITRVEVSNDAFDHLPVQRAHLTRSTYLRLLIPGLFPDEDRVIYMDCDMVVTGDLSLADTIELGSAPIAAVACPSPNSQEVAATGHVRGTYINAGFLVMNLPVWRDEGIADQCITLIADPRQSLLSEDQSAINIVCRGRIVYLPSEFNVYSDPNAYKRKEDLPMEPAVIHYVVNNKPWNMPTTLDALWRFHAKRIEDLMPDLREPSLRRRISLVNRNRKMIFGLLLRQKKYIMRNWVRNTMNGTIAGNYIARHRGR
ncbi:glycosyltransferase family 8 protein [Falsirhodobacter xinxiangensis]|uniref:glycosyltransferase family 8 protein n=1 Tax=Falsirhodobacter xinxiangensis TaxID=2530049 RepID=UPI0010A9C609|nr:glycosyltransferase family 8 protein [Rhodobacter xinxiangensis]